MGNRRLGRSRLYTIEKQGKTIDLSPGAGASPMIARTTQWRSGTEIITEIIVDLGTSKGTIVDGTVRYPIGVASKAATLGQLTVANVGVITEVRCVVTEAPGGGVADCDLEYGSSSVNTNADPSGTSIMTSLTTVGEDTSTAYVNNVLADKYLYICNGAGGSTATYTSGKFAIYLYGFAVPADL
tara:strand:- start:626 stop:1177 length:552 start_codon:yes stop_codon:yes gene_type:complete